MLFRSMAESKEELKSPLMKVKDEREKTGLKFNIQKMKIMASSPIISWHIGGETMETARTLFSWALKSLQLVTAARKLKDAFAPWKKNYYKHKQHIKKWRHYFSYKGLYSQSYGFSSSHVWM